MKPATLPGLFVSASMVLASSVASAAPPSPVEAKSAAPADRRAESARADEEDSGKAFSAAPLLGYGSNHFGLATGVRAGYTLPSKVYVGGTFMYHFGSTYGYAGYLGGAEYSTHVLYPAAEAGYELRVGPVSIRPYAGVGVAFAGVSTTVAGNTTSASDSSLLLYPGATAYWNIPRSDFFVGGDTRMLILTRGGDPSFGLYATAGIKF